MQAHRIYIEIGIILMLAALNIYASVVVWFRVEAEKNQKVAQLAFIWLLPIIGGTLALLIHQSASSSKYKKEHGNPTSITVVDAASLEFTNHGNSHE